MATLTELANEYADWMDANYPDYGPGGDAEEMLMHPDLTKEQYDWLRDFIERWDAVVEEDHQNWLKTRHDHVV